MFIQVFLFRKMQFRDDDDAATTAFRIFLNVFCSTGLSRFFFHVFFRKMQFPDDDDDVATTATAKAAGPRGGSLHQASTNVDDDDDDETDDDDDENDENDDDENSIPR